MASIGFSWNSLVTRMGVLPPTIGVPYIPNLMVLLFFLLDVYQHIHLLVLLLFRLLIILAPPHLASPSKE